MSKKIYATDKAPAAIGPYSQAVEANGFIFICGQIPVDPVNGEIVGDNASTQAKQSLKNLGAVLAECGLEFDDVVKTTVFLDNMDDFAAFNEVYAGFFSNRPPARSCVEVSRLPKGALVEIEAIATR